MNGVRYRRVLYSAKSYPRSSILDLLRTLILNPVTSLPTLFLSRLYRLRIRTEHFVLHSVSLNFQTGTLCLCCTFIYELNNAEFVIYKVPVIFVGSLGGSDREVSVEDCRLSLAVTAD
jgi:hypothetical protein